MAKLANMTDDVLLYELDVVRSLLRTLYVRLDSFDNWEDDEEEDIKRNTVLSSVERLEEYQFHIRAEISARIIDDEEEWEEY